MRELCREYKVQQSVQYLFLVAGHQDNIQIIGDIGAANRMHHALTIVLFDEPWADASECAGTITNSDNQKVTPVQMFPPEALPVMAHKEIIRAVRMQHAIPLAI